MRDIRGAELLLRYLQISYVARPEEENPGDGGWRRIFNCFHTANVLAFWLAIRPLLSYLLTYLCQKNFLLKTDSRSDVCSIRMRTGRYTYRLYCANQTGNKIKAVPEIHG